MSAQKQRPLCRSIANTLTNIRLVGGELLAAEITTRGPRFRSWKLAGAAALLMATDKLDGMFAHWSNIPSVEYAQKDEEVDKRFYKAVMQALGSATTDPRYFVYDIVTDRRNEPVASIRHELREHGLSAGARTAGKAKTMCQNMGILFDLSPAGEQFHVLSHAVHASAVGLCILSGVEIIHQGNKQLAAIEQPVLPLAPEDHQAA